MKTVYAFNERGYYIGSCEAQISPVDGVILMPPNTTQLKPPTAAGLVANFSGTGWSLLKNWAGTTYWLADGSEHTHYEFYEPEQECLLEPPIIPQPPLLETISTKINEVIAYGDTQDAKPFEYPAGSGIYYKVTDAVLKTIALSVALELPNTAAIPCNDGMWDNVYADISTPFTVGEFNAFYAYGYAIPEHNYRTMKAHVAHIMQFTTTEEVEAYDYTTDWR